MAAYLLALGRSRRRGVDNRGFRTKAEALEAFDEVKNQLRTGARAPPSRRNVGDFPRLLATITPELRPATLYSYRRNIRCQPTANR